jgi:hypothetical protein
MESRSRRSYVVEAGLAHVIGAAIMVRLPSRFVDQILRGASADGVADPESEHPHPSLLEVVSDELDADVYVISGDLTRELVAELRQEYRQARNRTNAVLILTTRGGDPDAAYLITRFLQRHYDNLVLFVFGLCKSAGTLVALGAHEIVMTEAGELGPLDVQVHKDDEIMRRSSGLDVFQALALVAGQAYTVFEQTFLQVLGRSGGVITTKTAAEIATNLASQLLSPLSAQIDPVKLGEVQRAINIAEKYGERLGAGSETIGRLVHGYPSHGFVIDVEEACTLFRDVRRAAAVEEALAEFLETRLLHFAGTGCISTPHEVGICVCLTQIAQDQPADTEGERNEQREQHDAKAPAGSIPAGAADGAKRQRKRTGKGTAAEAGSEAAGEVES